MRIYTSYAWYSTTKMIKVKEEEEKHEKLFFFLVFSRRRKIKCLRLL